MKKRGIIVVILILLVGIGFLVRYTLFYDKFEDGPCMADAFSVIYEDDDYIYSYSVDCLFVRHNGELMSLKDAIDNKIITITELLNSKYGGQVIIEETKLTKEILTKKLKAGAILIDVRSNVDYENNHIDNAINIPLAELEEKIVDVVEGMEQEIIVYCSNGGLSLKALKLLEEAGYKNVRNFGSIKNWK